MQKYLRVNNWDQYETNDKGGMWQEGQSLRALPFQYVRLRVNGSCWSEGFRDFLEYSGEFGAANFGVFCKLLELAGAQEAQDRGWIIDRHGNPADAVSISKMSGFTVEDVSIALETLTSPEVAWMKWELRDAPGDSGDDSELRPIVKESKGDESKVKEKRGEDLRLPPPSPGEFQQRWNEIVKGTKIPQCRAVSADRLNHLNARRKESVFIDNWEAAIKRALRSKFLTGGNKRGWTMTADWFLKPGSVVKIIEGKYDD
jgi:hypothetical protein